MLDWKQHEDASSGERPTAVWEWREGQYVNVKLPAHASDYSFSERLLSESCSLWPERILGRYYQELLTLESEKSALARLRRSRAATTQSHGKEALYLMARKMLMGTSDATTGFVELFTHPAPKTAKFHYRTQVGDLQLVFDGGLSKERDSLLLLAADRTERMLEEFEVLDSRLGFMIEIKKILRDLWTLTRDKGDKYAKQIALMLHESLNNARAEEMTCHQILAVRGILTSLTGRTLTLEDARTVQRVLLSVDLDYIRSVASEESLTS
jgi:hypothetical protein